MCEAKDFPPSERDELMGLVTQLQGQVAQLTAAKEEYTNWGDTRIRKRPGNHLQSRESKPARVEYEGEIMFLSVAAQKAMNSNWGLQGSQYWMYGGRTLQEIREQMEARGESD